MSVHSAAAPGWKCCRSVIDLAVPRIMGIVNVTPDSFSDGGLWFEPERAIEHGLALVEEGADMLDIGGVSNRPGAHPLPLDEELRRVVPVIDALARRCTVPLSIDTCQVEVAREALAAGAVIINHIAPLAHNRPMAEVIAASGAGTVLMHMRGTPRNMQELTVYGDVVAEVEAALAQALVEAQALGIAAAQLVIDPGIGFAKNTEQNLALLAQSARLAALAPLLIGASRKSFIGECCAETQPRERLGGSLAAALWAARAGAAILRVHDVKATRQALTLQAALEERSA